MSESKRVYLSLSEAFRLGSSYLIRRLDRFVLNVTSIALGLCFFTALIMTDSFYQSYAAQSGYVLKVELTYYWLVTVALTVSVVGITNSMLISVYERVKEIGTMKCLGALNHHILLLFFVEAVIQGLIGGLIGFTVGVFAALLTTGFTTGFDIIIKVPIAQTLAVLLYAVLISTLLSTIATLYPALRASRLDPVEALRYEL